MSTKKRARARSAKNEAPLRRWARRSCCGLPIEWDAKLTEALAPEIVGVAIAAAALAVALVNLRQRAARIGGKKR